MATRSASEVHPGSARPLNRPALSLEKKARIRRALKSLLAFCSQVGFDPLHMARAIRYAPRFLASMRTYVSREAPGSLPLTFSNLRPIFTDFRETAGSARGHYFHQDLYFARKIFEAGPRSHVDVGSRIDGFVAHLLVFMPVVEADIRPLRSTVSGLEFIQTDAATLEDIEDCSVDSISSLHAAEHFGLGRYGDPIDPSAHLTFMRSLQRVLRPGGRLYFSVPIGRERLEFNAHRIFAPETVTNTFSELSLVEFAAVDDRGGFVADAHMHDFGDAEYACGLFTFTK